MRLLYDDQLAPITSEIGFLSCEAVRAAQMYQEWSTNSGYKGLERRTVTGELETVLARLLPLEPGNETRTLFVPTRSTWAAYFDNGWRGSAAADRMGALCELLQCKTIRVACIPHSLRAEGGKSKGCYGATIMEVYSPDSTNIMHYERVVSSMNDGGPWIFDEVGEPYPFEDLESYKKKRIRDRFTPEMLDSYLQHFGIHAFDEDFYAATEENPAHLVYSTRPPGLTVKQYTLEEARADY